ncbi:anhydro-N-acetylmuramic acid kinase [Aequorivita sp. H23M31]|uniref:Anhydro-N-acetylmuramic acid kinase n=1 Tax=Aequorivita ciconiae TaxID=2494375 RepID=A0A410G3E0_9FLAO|nr:anhydro-N-acetylmuramic acid kinase [Aequorivita sp. H23M31]QAA81759.1 anhydro-N-acetylmuramic acid kinase [Aequorivita sp. H23M31]
MKKESYHIIGVMSGTSLDGIDLAEMEFRVIENPEDVENSWSFKILKAETIPYSSFWKKELQDPIEYSREQLERLDFKYTEKLSEDILGFIQRNNIQEIDAICSHGHTILHRPEKGFTLQIGNLPKLAKMVGQTVVCDFRVQDVELGGQGAPLVPIGDRLLFSEYDYCLNLGGFANVSSEINGNRIAYDICPVNIVLNRYAEKMGFDFDEGGNMAREGKINSVLLQKLNSLPFYSEKPPKSLGLEWVNENIFPLLELIDIFPEDVLRTFTEHIAIQLANQFSSNASILITGGGAHNTFLIERLKDFSSIEICIPSQEIVEYKEALIFGLLGVLKLRGEVNCLSSVTGAKNDHSSGQVFTP